MNYEKVMEKVQEHYDRLVTEGYEVVAVFLQGSQNYGLAYEGSDVDTKAMVLPSFKDVVFGKEMVSKTLRMPDDSLCDVKDVRKMFETMMKQNPSYVELLFTEFKIVNPKYEGLLKVIFDNAEDVARMNTLGAVNCMCGMSMEKFKALEKPYPSTKDKVEKYGYDPKQLHHIVRLEWLLRDYSKRKLFSSSLKPDNTVYLMDLKLGKYSLSEARFIAEESMKRIANMKAKFVHEERNLDMVKMFEDVATELITKHLKESLKD